MTRRFAQTRASAKHVTRSHESRDSVDDAQDRHDARGDARKEHKRAGFSVPGETHEDDAAFAHALGAARDEDAPRRDALGEMSAEQTCALSNVPGETRDEDDAAFAYALGAARDHHAALRDAPGPLREDGWRVLMVPHDENTEAEVVADAEHPARSLKSRYVPGAILREVFARDGGQCTFVSPEGRRCSAREFLEVHHHEPFARGGDASVDNLRLSCRAHNQFLAELDYGRCYMREKISAAQHAARPPREHAARF
jgi:hypothetical protein